MGVSALARKTVSDDFKVFSERLSKLMKERGLKQQDLASVLGVKRQTVSLYMIGQSMPDAEQLKKISMFFDVSADWLLGISEYKDKQIEKISAAELGFSENAISTLIASKEMYKSWDFTEIFNYLLSMDEFYSLLSGIAQIKKGTENYLKKSIPAPFTDKREQVELNKTKAERLLEKGGGIYRVIDEWEYLKMQEYYLQSAFAEIVHEVVFEEKEALRQLLFLEQGVTLK